MFEGYKVVCVTPAGRRRYLERLVPQVLSSLLVDEYQLWRNTVDVLDVEFLESLQQRDSRIRVIAPTEVPPGSNAAIRQFYPRCVDPDSVYIRFDDDIVYIEPDFFAKFLTFRTANPHYFVVFANIINNAVCTYVQMLRGTIWPGARLHPWCMDLHGWANPRFAEQLHRAFLESVVQGCIERWYFGPLIIALARFSTNCVSWLGRDFAEFGGRVVGDEEEFLSITKPLELMRPNCIYGDAVVSHFAFHPQRAHLDSTDLLDEYTAVIGAKATHSKRSTIMLRNGDLWAPRLLEAIENIMGASEDELQSTDFLSLQIRHAGLVLDHRMLYGADNTYMNTERIGLWQIPQQLARCLIELRNYRIEKVIDVGTASGWTVSILTAYLSRFNKDLRVFTVDVDDYFDHYDVARRLLPIVFHVGKTARDFAGEAFDLAFLDASHSYEGCRSEYEVLGANCAICAIHDIQDRFVANAGENHGGVPRFWKELKARTYPPDTVIEFLDHSENDQVMGIGLLVRDSAVRRMVAVEP